VKNIYSVEVKQKPKFEKPNKLEVTNHGQKSIRKHKRHIQCQ